MGARFLLTFATLLLSSLLVYAQNSPEVTTNYFENMPAKLYFFDDATVR
jgi:hypothetical protein